MDRKFFVAQRNEIVREGRIFDLHNCYDFSGLVLRTRSCMLQVLFDPNPEFGSGPPLSLIFDGVSYLEISPMLGCQGIARVDEMGYKNPGDADGQSLLGEKQASTSDHFFIRFEGSAFLRVHSEIGEAVVGPTTI